MTVLYDMGFYTVISTVLAVFIMLAIPANGGVTINIYGETPEAYYLHKQATVIPICKTEEAAKEKKYILYNNTKMNWYQSMIHCNAQNMKLATINSQAEQDMLVNMILDESSTTYWWIGGADLATAGTYMWISTGQPLVYTNWGSQDPNNLKRDNGEVEDCMFIDGNKGEWIDQICSKTYNHICEDYV